MHPNQRVTSNIITKSLLFFHCSIETLSDVLGDRETDFAIQEPMEQGSSFEGTERNRGIKTIFGNRVHKN